MSRGAIPGRATGPGTARYVAKTDASVAQGHFRQALGLELSSLGLGTYLGAADEATDARCEAAVRRALLGGCNVVDTAINYRHQRAERSIGRALAAAVEAGEVARDEVFVATKGGFVPFDGDVPDDTRGWFEATYVATGIVSPDQVEAGSHCLQPSFIEDQIGRSLANLGLETIDLYYLHNPETQLQTRERPVFLARLRAAFEACEAARAAGRIGAFGAATWDGCRLPPGATGHLSLQELVALAKDVGGEDHGFRAVQWPFNLALTEVMTESTQILDDELLPAALVAHRLDLVAFASVPLFQGRLLGRMPAVVGEALAGLQTDAQRALQFVRSAPGILSALVGMKQPGHLDENLAVAAVAPADEAAWAKLFTS